MPICWEALKSLLNQAEPAAGTRCQCLPLLHSFFPTPSWLYPVTPHQPALPPLCFKGGAVGRIIPMTGEGLSTREVRFVQISPQVTTPSQAHCFFSLSADAYCSAVKWPGFSWSLDLLYHFWSSPERWSFLHVRCFTVQSDTGLETWLPIQRPA